MQYKHKTKNILVDAIKMTREERDNKANWPAWLSDAWQAGGDKVGAVTSYGSGDLILTTTEGLRDIFWNDYIVRGSDGSISTALPNVFERMYEPALQ